MALAFVVVQTHACAAVHVRVAVGPTARRGIAAEARIAPGEIRDVVGDHQVQQPIAIVVEPTRAGRPPAVVFHTRSQRDIGECAVAVVVKQNAAGKTGEQNIGVAVVIVIPDSDTHSVRVESAA